MNRKFKKVISSVLAAVMTMGVVGVANVSSVFAAVSVSEDGLATGAIYWSLLGETSTTAKTLTAVNDSTASLEYVSNGSGYKVSSAYTSTNTGLSFSADDSKAPKITNIGSGTDNISGGNYIAVPASAGDEIYVYAYTNSANSSSLAVVNASISSTGKISFSDNKVQNKTLNSRGNVTEICFTAPESETEYTNIYLYALNTAMDVAAIVKIPAEYVVEEEKIDSTVTISSGSNGSVSVTDGSNAVTTGSTVKTGTRLTITATPDSGHYAVVKVNDEEILLTNNVGNYDVSTATTAISVTYPEEKEISEVVSDVTAGSSNVKEYGSHPTSDFYFECKSANVTVGSSYINVSGGTDNALYFKTGDFGDKKATLNFSFSSGSDTSTRTFKIYKDKTEEVYSQASGNRTAIDDSITLDSDTEYYICSAGSNMWLYSLAVSVEDSSDDEIVKASANKVAYVKVGDKVYAVAIIPKTQVDNEEVNSFYVSDGTADNKSGELTTVYSSIQIGETTYTATNFSDTNSDSLYAFEVTNGGDKAKAIIANAVVNYNTTTDVTE